MSHVIPRSRARSWLSGTAALLVLVILAVGIPLALIAAVGWPLPHQVPSPEGLRSALTSRGLPDRVFLDILACVAWLAWASAVASVVEEGVAAARGRSSKRIPVAGAFQPMAARLVATVLFAVLSLSRPQPASGPAIRAPLAAQIHTYQPDGHSAQLTAELETTPSMAAPAASPIASQTQEPASSPAYTVVAHDTLWSIAQDQLGDPLQWREIFALNEGRVQPDGRSLTDPNWIYPGWVLTLPAAPTAPAAQVTPPSPPQVAAAPPATTTPQSIASPSPLPPITTPGRPDQTEQWGATPTSHGHRADAGPAMHRPIQTIRPIRLPSGSVVAPSFAVGVLAALAVGRLRRRRRYRPSEPEPGRDLRHPDLSPSLRHLMHTAADAVPAPDPLGDESAEDLVTAQAARDPHAQRFALRDSRCPEPRSAGLVEIGVRSDSPISFDLASYGVLRVTGPASEDVVRSWVTALLTNAGEGSAEVLTTASLASSLFPGRGTTKAIRTVSSSETLLRSVEAEVVGRSRQLADAEVADAASYRTGCPEDPLPYLLVLADQIPKEAIHRWHIASKSAGRLDVAVVILGDHELAEAKITADTNGQIVSASPKGLGDQLRGIELFRLNSQETTELISLVSPESEEVSEEATSEASVDASRIWPVELVDQAEGSARPIEVRLLGPYQIAAHGEEVTKGLRSAGKELLAWYVLRPDGATAEAAVEALWPDTSPELVSKRFWRALGDLRSRLRTGDSSKKCDVLIRSGRHYRPDTEAITCDLWDFQDQLHRAARTDDDEEALLALRSAVDTYRGGFVADVDYLWIEPAREDLHRRALDAHFRLAELEEACGRHDAASEVLHRAIQLDPYAEEGFRRLMVLNGRLGRHDSISTAWRQLQANLSELELDPEPETGRLYQQLSRSHALQHVSTFDR